MSRNAMTKTEHMLCQLWRFASNGEDPLLVPIRPKYFRDIERQVLVTCGDMDRSGDILRHYVRAHRQVHPHDPLIQLFAWNGGTCRLIKSPASTKEQACIFQGEISEIIPIKDPRAFILFAHWPCGKASAANMSLIQVVEALMVAKTFLKSQYNEYPVSCFFHLDYIGYGENPTKMRTYHISRNRWEAWKEEIGISVSLDEPSPEFPPEVLELIRESFDCQI